MATITRTVTGQLSEVVPFLEAGVLDRSRSAPRRPPWTWQPPPEA